MKLLTFMLAAFIALSIRADAQTNSGKREATLSPVSSILPVIVAQQNCPLKVEGVTVAKSENGRYEVLYQVRNVSDKVVKSYSITQLYSSGTGSLAVGIMPNGGRLLKPGETTGGFRLPASESTKQSVGGPVKSDPDAKISRIVFVMIGEVLFETGEKYSDLDTFYKLTDHLKMFDPIYLDQKDDN
jgi:hypothetical protein